MRCCCCFFASYCKAAFAWVLSMSIVIHVTPGDADRCMNISMKYPPATASWLMYIAKLSWRLKLNSSESEEKPTTKCAVSHFVINLNRLHLSWDVGIFGPALASAYMRMMCSMYRKTTITEWRVRMCVNTHSVCLVTSHYTVNSTDEHWIATIHSERRTTSNSKWTNRYVPHMSSWQLFYEPLSNIHDIN